MKTNDIYIDSPSAEDAPQFYAPWHVRLGNGEISPRRLMLLAAIDATGSISQAAKSAGMTYKAAWDAVEIMNNLAGQPMVERQHGGVGGGGTTLTAKGKQLLATHQQLQAMQAMWMDSIQDMDAQVLPMMRRLTLRTSARNTFYGKIIAIQSDGVEAQVKLALQGQDALVVTVTDQSVQRMRLQVGGNAWALIKSTWVILAPIGKQQVSADNCLYGTVKQVQDNEIDCEVVLQLTGGNTLTSVVTQQSLHALNITEGQSLCAFIQSNHIILGSDNA